MLLAGAEQLPKGAFMWLVRIELTVTSGPSEDLPSFLDAAYRELIDIARECDPNMLTTRATSEVMFSMVVKDDDRFDAFRHATSTLHSALHGAGGHTPGWDQDVEAVLASSRMSSEPVLV